MARPQTPRYPTELHIGDEVAGLALKLPDSKHTIRLSFLWGDNDHIKVLGAHMVRPNVFEFPPHEAEQSWYLKFAVTEGAQPCQKIPYLTVHELRSRSWPVWLARLAASILFIASLVILLIRFSGGDLGQLMKVQVGIGPLAFSLPLTFVLLFFSWSSKVTEFIRRLFTLTSEVGEDYQAKGVPDEYSTISIHGPVDRHSPPDKVKWSNWHSVF